MIPPLSSVYDLSDLPDAGAEVVLAPNAAQRMRLAEWAGVDAVEHFEGRVILQRRSANRFAYDATVAADIVQSCVVTLEPVHSHLAFTVERLLHLTKGPGVRRLGKHELASDADERREEIEDSRFDLAGPLLEDFALAIDPYPRAPGVVFEPPADPEPRETPFAVLKPLKAPK
jgi:hypothetical protein